MVPKTTIKMENSTETTKNWKNKYWNDNEIEYFYKNDIETVESKKRQKNETNQRKHKTTMEHEKRQSEKIVTKAMTNSKLDCTQKKPWNDNKAIE